MSGTHHHHHHLRVDYEIVILLRDIVTLLSCPLATIDFVLLKYNTTTESRLAIVIRLSRQALRQWRRHVQTRTRISQLLKNRNYFLLKINVDFNVVHEPRRIRYNRNR